MKRRHSLTLALIALAIASILVWTKNRAGVQSPPDSAPTVITSALPHAKVPVVSGTLVTTPSPRSAPSPMPLSPECQTLFKMQSGTLDEVRQQLQSRLPSPDSPPERIFENLHFRLTSGEERRVRYDSSKNRLLLYAVDEDGPIPMELPPEDQNRPPLALLEEYRQRYHPTFTEAQFHHPAGEGSLTWLERDGQTEELTWVQGASAAQCSSPPLQCRCERTPGKN